VDHRLAAKRKWTGESVELIRQRDAPLVFDEPFPGMRRPISGFGKAHVRTVPIPTVAVSR
jgi:hypothetical protein